MHSLVHKYLLSIYYVPGTSEGRSPMFLTCLSISKHSTCSISESSTPHGLFQFHRLVRASALLLDPPESPLLLLPQLSLLPWLREAGTDLPTPCDPHKSLSTTLPSSVYSGHALRSEIVLFAHVQWVTPKGMVIPRRQGPCQLLHGCLSRA